MHVRAHLDAPVTADALFAWVGDLARYPAWLDIVRAAEPIASTGEGDGPARWDVVLQARVGPFRRSKRLRMARVGLEEGRRACFERCEADGRQHARWSLDARVSPHSEGSRLVMDLRYDGALWSPPLEHLLRHQIEQGKARLAALAAGAA